MRKRLRVLGTTGQGRPIVETWEDITPQTFPTRPYIPRGTGAPLAPLSPDDGLHIDEPTVGATYPGGPASSGALGMYRGGQMGRRPMIADAGEALGEAAIMALPGTYGGAMAGSLAGGLGRTAFQKGLLGLLGGLGGSMAADAGTRRLATEIDPVGQRRSETRQAALRKANPGAAMAMQALPAIALGGRPTGNALDLLTGAATGAGLDVAGQLGQGAALGQIDPEAAAASAILGALPGAPRGAERAAAAVRASGPLARAAIEAPAYMLVGAGAPGGAAPPATTPLAPTAPPLAKDFGTQHRLLSPLSITSGDGQTLRTGTYERLGGDPGKAVSELLRDVQRSGGDDPANLPLLIEERRGDMARHLNALREGRGTPDNLPLPGLADEIERHVADLTRQPKPYEAAYGNTLNSLTRGRVVDADQALRRHVDTLMGLGNALRLRFNVKSALVNLAQPLETLWPYVSTRDYAAVARRYMDPKERARLAEKGVLESSKVEGQAPQKSTSKWPATLRDPFGAASAVNRGIGYLYGEEAARRAGVTDPEQVHQSGLAWAEMVEFDNSPFNAPPVLRDTMGRFLLQYKGFTIKSLENLLGPQSITRGSVSGQAVSPMERLARVAKWGAAKAGVGGVKALQGPVGGLAVATYLAARQMARERGAETEEAEQIGRVAAMGLPTLMGADVSGSVGVLDPPFGETDAERLVNFAAGPTIGTALNVKKGVDDVLSGKKKPGAALVDTAKRLSPYARMGEAAWETARSVRTGTPYRYKVPGGTMRATTAEQIVQLLGGQPARRSMAYQREEARKKRGKR